MRANVTAPFLRYLQDDKADLARLHGALGEVLDGKQGSTLPSEVTDLRKHIEAEIRSCALRLVYRIDLARNSPGFRTLLSHIRSIRTILKHVATQMKPDSTDRFVVLLLEHHLETLLERQDSRYPNRLPQEYAA